LIHRRPPKGTFTRILPYLFVPLLFLIGAVRIQGYATRAGIMPLLVLSSMLGLACVGQTLVVIAGGVDLSIPAVMGLADVVLTLLNGEGENFVLTALTILGLAIAIGVANALLTTKLNVHSLIVTLGMGLVVTGGVLTWHPSAINGTVPAWITTAVEVISKTGPIPLPPVVIVWIVVSAAVIYFQRYTRLGREIYASGANPVAARLVQVRSSWVWIVAFCISAIGSAITGVFFAGFSGGADSSVGDPYLFETLTAIVVGGTSLLGGRGGYGRTIVGVLTVIQLQTLLIGAGLSSAMQEALLGALIVVLVGFYGREPHVATRL
jgi:ribose transport system permease protein